MQLYNLNDFTKGWVCGDFIPTLFPTKDFEVAVKHYKSGDYDDCHIHKIADEITIIVDGIVAMLDVRYKKDDIIWIPKGEETDFYAITDAVTCVIKIPCVKGDKYITKDE